MTDVDARQLGAELFPRHRPDRLTGVGPAHEKPQRERDQYDDRKGDDARHGEKSRADRDHVEGVRQVDGAGIAAEGDQQHIFDDDREPERDQEDVAIVAVAGRADDKALQNVACLLYTSRCV